MVWFQCEDCGENLKKPKLLNHFRICSATKLSCIDCGEVFGQQSVQGHTQCITEAEKYGPKGQGKAPNGMAAKPKNEAKQKPDFDVNVGLSERPPWFCSLCNTKATSKQTLLLHAEGKKHRAKARAFHAANKQPEQAEKSTPNVVASPESNQKDELPSNRNIEPPKGENLPKVASMHSSEAENWSVQSSKKRKLEATENDSTRDVSGGAVSGELGNGEVIQVERAEKQKSKHEDKKAKHGVTEEHKVVEDSSTKEDAKKKLKWKKLIKSALKSNPDGVLKLRKLRKLVLGSLRESGFIEDESQLADMLEQKINSSSKFTVDGKYVRLVAKS
ncbi:UBP1-associated proteins 1C [Rhododendron vialii]|uniref:UBP1-associated proteins 1C n=1 Tax=Rhododendron vialii TaxID=182163 RepID=UPI00265F27CD|nr:UBP1-associated proteins 1C [Rhododendron vialii]